MDQDEYTSAQKLSQQLVKIVKELFLSPDLDAEMQAIPELEEWQDLSNKQESQLKRKAFIMAIVDSSLRDIWLDIEEGQVSNDNDGEYLQFMECDFGFLPAERALKELTYKAFSILPAMDRRILGMQFGFGGKEYTVEEIAKKVGISVEKVGILTSAALRKLTYNK
jgi:DNA-directed RNA polymerase specialized sigma24 family protein